MTTYEEENVAITVPSIPHNREAEEAVLGSVLINPNCIYELIPFLKKEHFYIHRHRFIWEAFLILDTRRTPIDLLTVTEELDRRGQLTEIGGPAYLTALVNQVPSSLNAESYGRIVEAHAIRREIINAANTAATLAYNEEIPIEDSLRDAKKAFEGLDIQRDGRNFVSMGELFSSVYEETQIRAQNPKEVWGMATGLPKLDKKTGGLQLGELWYIPGAPGIGKTWLDLTVGMELGKSGPGAIFSLEMKKPAIGRRLMSGVSGVSTRAMKSGFMNENDWPLMTKAINDYETYPVWVDDSSYDSVAIRSTLVWAQREFGLRWFILDYALLLMDAARDETEQTKIISANLKRIVHDLNIGGIVLHSVTKGGMSGNEPGMDDQRGSGQAIHDCDLQLFLTKLDENDEKIVNAHLRPEQKKKMATLWCSKGRELEESKFKIHLTRRGRSPFWGEWEDTMIPEPPERKDYD